MAWVKIESSVARHRKFQQAGPAASWLWFCGLAYCQEGLTDGFIPIEALPYLGVRSPAPMVSRLVKAGLWDESLGGWMVHDYLLHNKSSVEIRRVNGDRRKAGSAGGHASGEKRRLTDILSPKEVKQVASALAVANAKQPANPSTATATTTDQNSGQTAVVASQSRPRPQPLMRGPRPDAAFDGGRVWVPHKVHSDFMRLRNGAAPELLAWYEDVCDSWANGADAEREPGANMFKFWEARYAEKWPAEAVNAKVPAWAR